MSTSKLRSGTRLRGPLTVVLTLTLMSLLTSALTLSPLPSASAATGDTDFIFVFANGETFVYPDASHPGDEVTGGTWHLDDQRFVDAGVAASVSELPDEFVDRRMHVSCSEEFPDGYDSGSDGNFPLASLHAPDWEVVGYHILNPIGGGKECGETFEPATVTVVKVTDPVTTAPFEFRLTGVETPCPGGDPVGCGGSVDDTRLVAGDGGSHTWTVNAGSYSLEEAEAANPSGYLLRDVTCTGLDPGETAAAFDVVGGETVSCAFENVRPIFEEPEGFVSVAKVVAGDESDVASFEFSSPESFALVDGETRTFGPYPVGTEVTFTEVGLGEDWMTMVGCGEGDPTETNSVTVTIVEGTVETAPVCTFTNTYESPPPPAVDLAIEKTDFGAKVVLNEDDPTGEIDYELTVTNLGPDDATGVVVTDTLPVTTTFVEAVPSQGSCAHAAGVVTCDLGGLAVDGSATIDLTVATEVLGELTDPEVENVAVVEANEEDVDPTNNEATEATPISEVFPLLLPQLSIDKVDLEDPIVLTEDDPDGRITYVVTVTNAADAGPATGVVVTDTLPATVTFHSVVPEQGSCSLAGQVLTCALGAMAPGDVVGITITVDTESFGELTVATVTNVVEVEAAEGDEPSDNRAEETTDLAEVRDEEVLPETGFPSATLAVAGIGSLLAGGLALGLGRRLDRRS